MDKSTFMNSNEYSRLSIESNVDMDFGVKIANGSFNGIVGKMQRNVSFQEGKHNEHLEFRLFNYVQVNQCFTPV